MLKLITVCSDLAPTDALTNSAVIRGWSLVKIKCEWKGFGTKIIETYNYLKNNPEVTEFVFCDAYDVICLGTPDEFKSKLDGNTILLSAEKGLWPPTLHPFKCKYANTIGGFNFINSGLYYSTTEEFIYLFERYPPFYEIDDQYWLNMAYLMEEASAIQIDYVQSIFNCHSFIADGEYTYENNRVQILGNEPIFIHFNGRTVDEKFNELIKL